MNRRVVWAVAIAGSAAVAFLLLWPQAAGAAWAVFRNGFHDVEFPCNPLYLSCSKYFTSTWQETDTGQLYDVTSEAIVEYTDQPGDCPAGHVKSGGTSYTTRPDGEANTEPWYTTCARVQVPNRPPAVTISCPASVGVAEAAYCSASASDPDGDPISYAWSNGSANSAATYIWYSAGAYGVSVSVSDGKGGTASASATVQVKESSSANRAPTISVSCPPTAAPGQSVSCSAATADPDGDPVTVTWSNGSTGGSASYSWPTAGSYSVSATARDNKGASATGSASVTVGSGGGGGSGGNRAPVLSVSCPSSTEPFKAVTCTANASDPDGDPVSITWSNGAAGGSAGYSWGAEGTYTVSASARDNKGASASASAQVQVGKGNSSVSEPPPCSPDEDNRSLGLSLNPLLVRNPGGVVTATATVSGRTTRVTATASWGEVTDMQYSNGTWTAAFTPPGAIKGEMTVTASASIRQSDGCGGTYGPSVFERSARFTVYGSSPLPRTPAPPDDAMTATALTLEQYQESCLGEAEPWYCGLNPQQAEEFTRQIQGREGYYLGLLGEARYRLLVDRIDGVLTESGGGPSGLYMPAN